MNYLTTTDLRTKTNELVTALLAGELVDLVHRSRVVGRVHPVVERGKALTRKDIERMFEIAEKRNLPKLSDEEIENRYRQYLEKRYVKNIS